MLIAPNILVVVGGSKITNGLSKLTTQDYVSASSEIIGNIPQIKSGRLLRSIGQGLFALGILFVYAYLYLVYVRARKAGVDQRILLLLAASAPFMLVRAAFGILSSASFEWSYCESVVSSYHPTDLTGGVV